MILFPLTDLPRLLMEKVITKLSSTSYSRLQRTCWGMNEFVRTIKTGRVLVNCELDLTWSKDGSGSFQIIFENIWSVKFGKVDIESLYGVQVDIITPPPKIEEEFELFCDILAKYCITADLLSLSNVEEDSFELTREQCATLIKVLKPARVSVDSRDSNRIEALLHLNHQEKVYLAVDPDDALTATKMFLPRLGHIEAILLGTETLPQWNQENIISLFISILEFLRSTPLLHLLWFKLKAVGYTQFPALEETMNKFRDFTPTLDGFSDTQAYTLKCMLGRTDYSCRLVVYSGRLDIHVESPLYFKRE